MLASDRTTIWPTVAPVARHRAAVVVDDPHRGHEALAPAGLQPLGMDADDRGVGVVLLGQEAHRRALGLPVALDQRAREGLSSAALTTADGIGPPPYWMLRRLEMS